MGDVSSMILNHFFDYPLKEKPCSYEADSVSTSGKKNRFSIGDEYLDDHIRTEYEQVTDIFNRKLAEKRREMYGNQSENDIFLKTFQDWNETTLSYLHSLFLTFCDEDNKMLSYKSFNCVLECLYDESSEETRKNHFSNTDKDGFGFMDYYDFLHTLYNFHPPDKADGLKRLCIKVAEKAILVNSLSLEKQLKYGLF